MERPASGLRFGLLLFAVLTLALSSCDSSGEQPDTDATIAARVAATVSAVQTATASAQPPGTDTTPTPSREPTPSPIIMCTPPACQPDEVYFCPGDCPGGCGTVCATVPAPPPDTAPERVRFAPGTTGAQRTGTLAPGTEKSYVLGAAVDQLMWIFLTSENAPINAAVTHAGETISVAGRRNSEFGNYWTDWSHTLPSTGDYTVIFTNVGDVATTYSVEFSIRDQVAQEAPPERVRIAPGATAAQRSGTLQPGYSKSYVLGAAAGQDMWVQVNAFDSPINVAVIQAGATVWSEAVFSPQFGTYWTNWRNILPYTGDYTVMLLNVGEMISDYDVSFSITEQVVDPTQPPQRVEFPAGATAVTVQGELNSQPFQEYVLSAAQGQNMRVSITGYEAPVTVSAVDPNGYHLDTQMGALDASTGGYRTETDFMLPVTGDYVISLWRDDAAGATSYEVAFLIE